MTDSEKKRYHMCPTFANFMTPPPPLLSGYTLCSVIYDGQNGPHRIQIVMNDKPIRKKLVNLRSAYSICD